MKKIMQRIPYIFHIEYILIQTCDAMFCAMSVMYLVLCLIILSVNQKLLRTKSDDLESCHDLGSVIISNNNNNFYLS